MKTKLFFIISIFFCISSLHAQSTSRYLKEISHTIALQLNRSPDTSLVKANTLAILSIVDLDHYKSTSDLGKMISENLIYEMQSLGYKILDYKATNAIVIDKKGEYLFSRALKDLKNQREVTYALSGTYRRYKDSLTLNCRIINLETNIVVATANLSIRKSIVDKIEGKEEQNDWIKQFK